MFFEIQIINLNFYNHLVSIYSPMDLTEAITCPISCPAGSYDPPAPPPPFILTTFISLMFKFL